MMMKNERCVSSEREGKQGLFRESDFNVKADCFHPHHCVTVCHFLIFDILQQNTVHLSHTHTHTLTLGQALM